MQNVPALVGDWFGEGEDVIMDRDAACDRDGCIQAESLANDEIEIREGVELFHGRRVCWHCQ